jgi:hypothetical protein
VISHCLVAWICRRKNPYSVLTRALKSIKLSFKYYGEPAGCHAGKHRFTVFIFSRIL